MKKWFYILLALGLCFTTVYADDDDDWDDDDYEEEDEEEILPATKKLNTKSKKKKKPTYVSRIGLSVGFSGAGNTAGFIYDIGNGVKLGLGLGFNMHTFTPDEEGDEVDVEEQTIVFVPSISYSLGTGLLNYGLYASADLVTGKDAGMDIGAFLGIYTGVELVKNLAINVAVGANIVQNKGITREVEVPRLDAEGKPMLDPDQKPIMDLKELSGSDFRVNLMTKGMLIFYFL